MIGIYKKQFLTLEECEDIKNKVFSLKQLWVTPDVQRNETILSFLPPALYISPSPSPKINWDAYLRHASETRPVLMENFSIYYDRIKEAIETIFKKPATYDHKLSLPGFHIFTAPKPNSFHGDTHMHVDAFRFHNVIPDGAIYSLLIPIVLPESGSGLLYIKDDLQKHMMYNIGMLGFWDGNVKHSIDAFTLKDESDYRITMQFHACVTKELVYIFW